MLYLKKLLFVLACSVSLVCCCLAEDNNLDQEIQNKLLPEKHYLIVFRNQTSYLLSIGPFSSILLNTTAIQPSSSVQLQDVSKKVMQELIDILFNEDNDNPIKPLKNRDTFHKGWPYNMLYAYKIPLEGLKKNERLCLGLEVCFGEDSKIKTCVAKKMGLNVCSESDCDLPDHSPIYGRLDGAIVITFLVRNDLIDETDEEDLFCVESPESIERSEESDEGDGTVSGVS